MNPIYKNAIRNSVSFFSDLLSDFVNSLVSCFRMMVLSSPLAAFKSTNLKKLKLTNECTILANGPSLKSAIEQGELKTTDCELMCVNMFCNSPFFWQLKPRFYFLVDGQYFNPTIERCKNQVKQLKEAFSKVDWEMYVVISTASTNGGILSGLTNPKVKVLRINTTTIEGFSWFRHFFYRIGMGMPRCQTVTNMTLSSAILMEYKCIYLYGADHSWTKDLYVDDNNVCCYGDRHVYKTSLEIIKLDYDISTLLSYYANMFKSHKIISEYAKSVGCQIWNCTRGSFVDAYDRFKYNN